MESSKAIREFGYDYQGAIRIQSLLESVPTNDRGMILFLVVLGDGEGEGARHARELVTKYFQNR